MQGRILPHQFQHGVDFVQAPRPEVFVVPCIFADRYGEAYAIELDHLLLLRGGKVALLVKDIVEGQEALVLLKQNVTGVDENRGIDGRLAGAAVRRERHAGEYRRGQIAGSRRELVDSAAAAGEEAR